MTQGLWQIVRFDRQTGETHPLTTGFGGAVRPAISPDGHTLAFLGRRDADTVLVARDLRSGAETDRRCAAWTRISRKASRRWTSGRTTRSPPTAVTSS